MEQLAAWGWPYDTELTQDTALLVAELAANAALHGATEGGRCFRLRMEANETRLRIEVTDAQPTSYPPCTGNTESNETAESGRGIQLIEAVATQWGVANNCPYSKTIWCELSVDVAESPPASGCQESRAVQEDRQPH